MRLDRLELELRPRPNAQALDLGFALLRSHAGDAYASWLLLWLPLMAACGALAWLYPQRSGLWLILAWWLRPLLERAPLYVLSRRVFGEQATWKDALRAWPRQLGGGWLRAIVLRPFAAARSFYQPIWQLEGARGRTARERYRVLAKNNTASSAFWFGAVCAHFEVVLEFGFLAFIGIFTSSENSINPFSFLFDSSGDVNGPLVIALMYAAYAFAAGLVGPLYVACGFTLYLNRRATLEAWDIEIALRQIKPPAQAARPGRIASAAAWLLPALLAVALAVPQPVLAASAAARCEVPDWVKARAGTRQPDHDAAQAALRRELAQLYDSDELRPYLCEERWVAKNRAKEPPRKPAALPDLALAAEILRFALIVAALFAAGWLAFRYRERFGALLRRRGPAAATEVAGLDIRAESLPADVAGAVRQLWAGGERRAALGLLYRASLARLVSQDGLFLGAGATEGDCLRAAADAHRAQRLGAARLQIVTQATRLWRDGAYGGQWPDAAAVDAQCAAWQAEFDAAREPRR